MKDEIKEILEILENSIYCKFDLHTQEKKKLLNFITNLQEKNNNLQEENERLKENNQNMQIEMARTWEENERLKQDIKDACIVIEKLKKEKKEAIEYIKENEFYLDYKTGACIKGVMSLLNILQGDDKE